MLSIETEARVAKILTALAEGERSIEISRQVLCENNDFNAYQLFKELDSEGKNRIDTCNLIEFLKRRSVYAAHGDAELIIQFYDEDGDRALSYSEFLNMVQSSNSFLTNFNSSSGKELSFNVEYSMGKLLEKEVDLAKNIDNLIYDAKLRCDFNVHELYHCMKGYNSITTDSLKQFLERQNVQCLDSDIKAIIKRLDINNDGRVDLFELSSFFGCQLCHCGHCSCCRCTCCHHHSTICCRNSTSPLRQSQSIDKEDKEKQMASSISNGFKSTYQTASPQQNNKREIIAFPEVKKVSPNLSLRLSPERRFSPNMEQRNSPLRNSQQQEQEVNSNNMTSSINSSTKNTNNEEKQFIKYLQLIMESEAEIEKMKIDLALRCDFNVEDAYRVFELNGRGFVTEDDLKYGLSLLDVYASNSDIKNLIRRYDLQGKGILNFGDFFDMITPYETDYRSMVENRPPNNCCCCRCLDAFTCLTRTYFQSLLRTLISTESKCNSFKLGNSSLRRNLEAIFSSLDLLNLGYFTDSDLEAFLKRKNVLVMQKECDLLFIHLDRNRDGKIEYWEISDEFTPVY